MTMMSVVRVLVVFAAFTFIAQGALSLAADETAKPKKTKATLEAKAPAEAKTLAKVPGSPGILATKASGADKVAKARSCSGVTPKIRKVSPDEGATGAKITITGENFGDAGCLSGVSFGPGSPAKFSQVDDKTITVTVPDGKRGLELLTVTGFTGEDSKPFLRK